MKLCSALETTIISVLSMITYHILTNKKSSGSHDGSQDRGYTLYAAMRIVQNNNGLFIKLNDATFANTDANRNRVANPQKTCAYTHNNVVALVLHGHRFFTVPITTGLK